MKGQYNTESVFCIFVFLFFGCVLVVLAGDVDQEPTIAPYYAEKYELIKLGPVPGVPGNYGCLIFDRNDPNLLMVGGDANQPVGALYGIRLSRGPGGHIIGFQGEARRAVSAAYNDGGGVYGPDDVLFLTRWPVNELGLVRRGSVETDKVIELNDLNVSHAAAGIAFVPENLTAAGDLKLLTWQTGGWYTLDIEPDGDGLFDVVAAERHVTLGGGPDGFTYVPAGSPLFADPAILVAEWTDGYIAAYDVNDSGDPVVETRRDFVIGLKRAEGAVIDPLTGDLLFCTWGLAVDHVVLVRGFKAPEREIGDGILETFFPLPEHGRVYIMLDASGSLLEQYRGKITFDYLREAVRETVRNLPAGTEVALRVFGHQYRAIEPEAERDTKLEIPMGPLDLETFEAKLDEIRPRGKTPLALTLREAARDLLWHSGRADEPVLVVLVADGEENTRPRQDPIAAARELAQVEGLDFHVIGFDVERPEHAEQLRLISEILDASLQMADEPTEIAARIDAIFQPAPPLFQLFDRNEQLIIESARFGYSVTLPEGEYILRIRSNRKPVKTSLRVYTNATTVVDFNAPGIFISDHLNSPSADMVRPGLAEPTQPECPASINLTRFCTGCGRKLGEDSRFCTGCGRIVQ